MLEHMRIREIIWLEEVIEKLAVKHHVEPHEVEEVLCNEPRVRLLERGHQAGEDVFLALGRSDAG